MIFRKILGIKNNKEYEVVFESVWDTSDTIKQCGSGKMIKKLIPLYLNKGYTIKILNTIEQGGTE